MISHLQGLRVEVEVIFSDWEDSMMMSTSRLDGNAGKRGFSR
jgi:hypothetical protein